MLQLFDSKSYKSNEWIIRLVLKGFVCLLTRLCNDSEYLKIDRSLFIRLLSDVQT